MKSPWFLALDVDSDQEALNLVDLVEPWVGGFKLGPRLCLRYGPGLVREIASRAPVFLDHKFYDIPSTMRAAVEASFDLGASFVTIHASCGAKALADLAQLERDLNSQREFKILAVTVLTSFGEGQLPSHWRPQSIQEHIAQLAEEVRASGLTGLVCSPFEAGLLRQNWPEAYLVTPGVRLSGDSLGDQQRVMGPGEALIQGASALVVGRPVVAAAQPAEVAQAIFAELKTLPSGEPV